MRDGSEVTICKRAQHSVEGERNEFRMLPARILAFEHMAEAQDCLVFATRDLKVDFFIHRRRVLRQLFKRFGDRCG
jgi:hypothetical protein